ncbi:MAG: hypothetical protein AAGC65_05285 [Mucilaginibacter sp.]|uniref:hypothetical protein n=1 Tax=Mucilaginibacter sp. TaxID=1882438 RepID=UPI0031B1F930
MPIISYLNWNNLLGDFFFSPEYGGKIITLVISQDDILAIARNSEFSEIATQEDLEIINDFKEAWRSGHPGISGNIIEKINREDSRGKSFYKIGRDHYNCGEVCVRYPPSLMHLAGVNIAILEGRDTSRYQRIREYFQVGETTFPTMSEHLNWNTAWDNLVWWANVFMNGRLGYLPGKSLSSEKFEYIGKPYTFILLSRSQLRNFYKFFFDQDLEPQTSITNHQLLAAFKNVKGNDNISKLLANVVPSPDQELIFAILRQLYFAWDGEYQTEVENQRVTTVFQSRKLRLCFQIDHSGTAAFSFRFKEEIYHETEILIGKQNVTISNNHWSSPLPLNGIPGQQVLIDESIGLKLTFKPSEDMVFVFVNGRAEGLHSEIYIESDYIHQAASQYLLINRLVKTNLDDWLSTNGGLDESEDLSLADQKDWFLFHFQSGIKSNYPSLSKLKSPSNRSLELHDGLKGNERGEWIAGFALIATLSGAKGNEVLVLEGAEYYEFELNSGLFFEISPEVLPGSYQLKILNAPEFVFLPNGGHIIFSALDLPQPSDTKLISIDPCPEEGGAETTNYHQGIALTSSGRFDYPPPPQFRIWHDEELNLETMPASQRAAVLLMEYLLSKGDISKMSFDNGLSAIQRSVSKNIPADIDFHKMSSYTINGLKEGSRITVQTSEGNAVSRISPVRPWLFRLGNLQNFRVEGINSGMQPFKGALYVLAGAYSISLLERIRTICETNNATFKIYKEGSDLALIPPSVFVYVENDQTPITEICQLLDQQIILPYFRYLSSHFTLQGKFEDFKKQREWDLHMPSRYQIFDVEKLAFTKKPELKAIMFPSLSLYEISPWQKYHVLRFEEDEIAYKGSIDPRWGKYMLLNKLQQESHCYFDDRKNILFIPASLRLPAEIERNLFYLTGRMPSVAKLISNTSQLIISPHQRGARSYLMYKGILKTTAEILTGNLGQTMLLKTLINYD